MTKTIRRQRWISRDFADFYATGAGTLVWLAITLPLLSLKVPASFLGLLLGFSVLPIVVVVAPLIGVGAHALTYRALRGQYKSDDKEQPARYRRGSANSFSR